MSVAALVSRALDIDAAGLTALRDAVEGLTDPLEAAADLILSRDGRLIVTGVGKSGHVGAKLAATFASTGTPAYFIHPAEASHGDLGMIQPSDAIFALSWSGETQELSDIIGYAKRRSVPLIAVTGAGGSTLARAADVALVLPKVQEACPHGLAPTTSTLVQMAMGDALAVALLQKRGFSEEGFHGFHPGGSLGAALKRVTEVMHPEDSLPLVPHDAPAIAAISELSAKGYGIVGVTKGPRLSGVVTDGDVRRYLERNATSTMQAALHDTPVAELMSRDPVVLPPDMIVGEALSRLQVRKISAAFVVENGQAKGLVTMLRLLNRGAA